MEKYILILIVFIYAFGINAQNIIDPPPLDTIVGSTIINRNFTGFVKGWNWGSEGAELDRALGINFYHGYPVGSTDVGDSMNVSLVIGDPIIGNGRNANQLFVALGIQLEPTITVDPTEGFVPRAGDKCGSVFGFRTRNFTVGDTSTDFNRFVLRADSVQKDSSVVVLKDIWDGKILRWLDYDGNHHGTMSNIGITNDTNEIQNDETIANDRIVYHPFNGKQYCLSINLRAMESDSVESHLTDTILVLRMPYTLHNDSSGTTTYSNVKFDSIPRQSFMANDSIIGTAGGDYRGIARGATKVSVQPTEIYITGEMLKNLSDTNKSITLSAYAKFAGIIIDTLTNEFFDNPLFRYDWYENRYNLHEYITEVDVEVEYRGKLDVGIDWIRIETPRLRKLMRGEFDDSVRDAISEKMSLYYGDPKNPRISRFYAMDEMTMVQWSAGRYFNMLVDTLADVELFVHENKPARFRHATAINIFRNGANLKFRTTTAAPYIKKTIGGNHPETFDYSFGYNGNTDRPLTHIFDSEYETFLAGYYTTIPINDNKVFEYEYGDSLFNYPNSTLFQIEDNLYDFYYKNQGLLFMGKNQNWVANLWVQSEAWLVDTTIKSFALPTYHSRPKTGEEVRLMMNEAVLLGAKGLVYWIKRSYLSDYYRNVFDDLSGLVLGFQDYDYNYGTLKGKDLIYSATIGGDFVQSIGDPSSVDPNGFDTVYTSNAYLYDTLGIDSTRIYIGLQSMRAEIYKLHKWIDEYEDLLMSLKLISWHGNGYTDWTLFDPQYPEDPIDKYIDIGWTKTRPPGRVDSNYRPIYEQASSIDSGFYDVTLHFEFDSNGNKIDSMFYLGIQNRRTDPLIRRVNDTTSLDFYSSAEFDKFIVSGGRSLDDTMRTSDWWQSKWWERLGCREISVKLDLPSDYDNKLIKITELGLNYDTLKAIHTFNGDTLTDAELKTLYPRYKKIISSNGYIRAKYLPGEGKLFKCEIIDEDDDLKGNLSNSNQCKLVAFPVLDSTGALTKDIQYHLVYFKTDSTDSNRVKVYYSRSLPLDSMSRLEAIDPTKFGNDARNSQNIIWQRFSDTKKAFIISDDYLDYNNQQKNSEECDYPAIVVRKDTNDNKLKAYIVYTCKGDATNDNADVVISCLDVTNPYSDPIEIINRKVDTVKTPADSANQPYTSRSQWGTPVVNASANGLYYAWTSGGSDNPPSNSYLKIAYAPPSNGLPTTTTTIQNVTFSINNDITMNYYQYKYPSVNTYSSISSGEEHCSLVWSANTDIILNFNGYEPDDTLKRQRKILYTNLKLNSNGQIYDTIPHISNGRNRISRHDDLNKVAILIMGKDNTYPVINRLSLDLSILFINLHLRFESVFSQYTDYLDTKKSLASAIFLFSDEGNTFHNWYDCGLTELTGNGFYNISQPTISQPSAYDYYYTDIAVISSYIVNYNLDGSVFQSQYFKGNYRYNAEDSVKYLNYITEGTLPHLSQYPGANFKSIWKNRRVYNDSISIMANPKYFFFMEPEDKKAKRYLGFSKDSGSVFLGRVLIDNAGLSFNLPVDSISYQNVTGYYYSSSDTLYSDWFSVSDSSYLRFETFSLDSTAKLLLQYGNDSSFVDLTLPITLREDSCYYVNYNLMEGESYVFRLVLVGNDTDKVYKEQEIIDGLPVMDSLDYTIYLSRPIVNDVPNQNIINNSIILEITPNPVKDVVYVTARVPQQTGLKSTNDINLKLLSLDGSELNSITIKTNVRQAISLEKYSHGVYFIKAEISDMKLRKKIYPAVKKFIIER